MWNILVVDDSATARTLLARTLEKLGHRALLADSGERALEVCALVRPDLVFLDVMMPDIDGWELAGRLRALEGLRAVPLVFQSSVETPEEIARCFACGAADVLAKPIRIAALSTLLDDLLGPVPTILSEGVVAPFSLPALAA